MMPVSLEHKERVLRHLEAQVMSAPKFGRTVADAKRLLAQASEVQFAVRIGRDNGAVDFFVVDRATLATSLKHRKDTDVLPCELSEGVHGLTLYVGSYDAILAADQDEGCRS